MNKDLFDQKYSDFYQIIEKLFGLKIDQTEEREKLHGFMDFARENGLIHDTTQLLSKKMKEGKRILAEGANGALLDIDHGSYPFVTSSNTTAGGICTGLGVPPTKIETVIGTVKAYTTRVGSGPFPTELSNELGEHIRKVGGEIGVTTGRPRRCGWLDLNIMKKSVMLNGYSSLLITKLDILSDIGDLKILLENNQWKEFGGWKEDISQVRTFDKLPKNAQNYIKFIEEYLEVPISWIGVGPERDAIIQLI